MVTRFKVGDQVYVSDICKGPILDIGDDGAGELIFTIESGLNPRKPKHYIDRESELAYQTDYKALPCFQVFVDGIGLVYSGISEFTTNFYKEMYTNTNHTVTVLLDGKKNS